MELGDKETVAIQIQASVTCYLHVIHRYTRMVYKIVPYTYGTEHRDYEQYPHLRLFTSRNNMASIVCGLCTENVW